MVDYNYIRAAEKVIDDFLMAPYKIKILKIRIDNLSENELEKIDKLTSFIELVKDNIDHSYLVDLDLLFRYSSDEVMAKSNNYTKSSISKTRSKIRKKFYDLAVKEGLI